MNIDKVNQIKGLIITADCGRLELFYEIWLIWIDINNYMRIILDAIVNCTMCLECQLSILY